MRFDYSILRGRIKDEYKTLGRFAEVLGISFSTLSKLLNHKSHWTAELIMKSCQLLGIEVGQIGEYFFTLKYKKY